MATQTTNYNLKKPDGTDNYNIQDHNDNMDAIDAQMKANANAAAAGGVNITSGSYVGDGTNYEANAIEIDLPTNAKIFEIVVADNGSIKYTAAHKNEHIQIYLPVIGSTYTRFRTTTYIDMYAKIENGKLYYYTNDATYYPNKDGWTYYYTITSWT